MDTISRLDAPTAGQGRAALKVFVVLAHPERRSFNGAMADTAVEALRELGHDVALSDLYRMGFDPVSDRRNFTTVKDSGFFKQQVEKGLEDVAEGRVLTHQELKEKIARWRKSAGR